MKDTIVYKTERKLNTMKKINGIALTEKGVLKTVDSSQGTEETFKEIEKILGSEDVNN